MRWMREPYGKVAPKVLACDVADVSLSSHMFQRFSEMKRAAPESRPIMHPAGWFDQSPVL
jgi:hypothetical protein